MFVEIMFNGAMYIGGIYRHSSGNVSYLISAALECVLHKVDTNRTIVLAGDTNIDIIKFSNEDVSYVSTLMSFKYLPYILGSHNFLQRAPIMFLWNHLKR